MAANTLDMHQVSFAAFHAAQTMYDLAKMPFNMAAQLTQATLDNDLARAMPGISSLVATAALTERLTRSFSKQGFDLDARMETILSKPFADLVRFVPAGAENVARPPVLLFAPMSGHYATLLKKTVTGLLETGHDVYLTDWKCARQVPLAAGKFDLDDYILYAQEFMRAVPGDVNVMAVCQPGPPVLAAIALMAAQNDPKQPKTMTFMGSPMDTGVSPTVVNKLATDNGTPWFERNVLTTVPFWQPGAGRRIYSGELQLFSFVAMNRDKHVQAHIDFYNAAMRGDKAAMESHKKFYDEYNAVLALSAEFYLQTIDRIFVKNDLAQGRFVHTDAQGKLHLVDPSKIRRTALLMVEGERDDITALGQTRAVADLCTALKPVQKNYYMQAGAGHYGIFSGTGWRNGVLPVYAQFVATHARSALRQRLEIA